MRRYFFALLLIFIAIPRTSYSGAFCAAIACDTLSTDPVRILDRLILIDICSCRSICDVTLDPFSYQGSAIVPILGGVGSSEISCTVDSLAGTAVFAPSACISRSGWYFNDGIGVVVGEAGACFYVTLHGLYGFVQTNFICFGPVCSAPTPALSDTWGALRAAYR